MKKMGRKKQLFRPNVLKEGLFRTSRWRLVGTGMREMTSQRSLSGPAKLKSGMN